MTTLDVRHVKFLNTSEAVVFFSVTTTEGRTLLSDVEGRAVVEHHRWKVARAAFASLMRIGGIDCPPPGPE